LKLPTLKLAIAFNRSVRGVDEWFSEPDDLDRVERALEAAATAHDPIEVAALIASRVARCQGFTEGNKRTAFLLAKWVLDNNGINSGEIIRAEDEELRALLIKTASGGDIDAEVLALFHRRLILARRRQGPRKIASGSRHNGPAA
jgi:prophage maintenance system killer protein